MLVDIVLASVFLLNLMYIHSMVTVKHKTKTLTACFTLMGSTRGNLNTTLRCILILSLNFNLI